MFLRLTRPGRPWPNGDFVEKSMCFCESKRTMNDGMFTTCLRTLSQKKNRKQNSKKKLNIKLLTICRRDGFYIIFLFPKPIFFVCFVFCIKFHVLTTTKCIRCVIKKKHWCVPSKQHGYFWGTTGVKYQFKMYADIQVACMTFDCIFINIEKTLCATNAQYTRW